MAEQPRARSAFGEFNRKKKEEEARQMAQLIAASISLPNSQPAPHQVVSIDDFNKIREELERTKDEFNRVKQELEVTKGFMQSTQQEITQYKPLVYDYNQKLKDQLEATQAYINDELVINSSARIPYSNINYGLIFYARDEWNVYITEREVKPLMEKCGVSYKGSNGQYYYYGVDIRNKT